MEIEGEHSVYSMNPWRHETCVCGLCELYASYKTPLIRVLLHSICNFVHLMQSPNPRGLDRREKNLLNNSMHVYL